MNKTAVFYVKRSILWLRISAILPFGIFGVILLLQSIETKSIANLFSIIILFVIAIYCLLAAQQIEKQAHSINTELLSKISKIKWITASIVVFTLGGGLILLNAVNYLFLASSSINKELLDKKA